MHTYELAPNSAAAAAPPEKFDAAASRILVGAGRRAGFGLASRKTDGGAAEGSTRDHGTLCDILVKSAV